MECESRMKTMQFILLKISEGEGEIYIVWQWQYGERDSKKHMGYKVKFSGELS